ncbi:MULTISPECIES: hypothetical protein [unclassified Acinetobacter]|uniref:hypothetical protein n=1 Tax=unclassified Acinetobacter TaxID=196816 RepID=UPI000EFA03E1|nr:MULTISPECIES: hypothetical protein [unclassified Acinetobacter]MCH7336474.1 hypothetical protein [Acinetobacter sp. NIPH 2699]RLZ06901.1 hypothetical protein EAH57_14375 [Acinetobacter sp. 2JN-4]
MKNEAPKEIKFSQINIGNKFKAQAYNYLAKAISYTANKGNKSPFCLLVTYEVLPNESHSAFAHQEYALFNPELNYIQDGFLFVDGKMIAIQIAECIPIYDAEILIDWRNNDGRYTWKKAIVLPLDVIETLSNYAEFAQDYNDYIHLGYTTLKTPRYDSPCIGIDGYLLNLITHTLRADARKYHIQGQDSVAFHLRTVKRLNDAVKTNTSAGGLPV